MTKIALTLDEARERFHCAHKAAKAADRVTAALYDRLASDTLLAVKGQPVERAVTMLVRMAVAFEVLAERRGWPDVISGLPDARPRRKVPAGIAGVNPA
jgi:hypothetical protein